MNKWEREAATADEELKKLLGTEGNTGDTPPEGNTPPEGVDAPAEPGKEPTLDDNKPKEESQKEQKKDDDAIPVADIKAEYEKLQADHTKLLAAHSVLQGKYSAEVPRMADEIANLKKEIETLKASATPKAPEKPKGEIAKRLADDYGEEFVADIKSVLLDELKAEMGAEIKSVREKVENVSATTQATAQERFITDLTGACPDWKDIKDDANFSVFLAEIEPFSGRPRIELAREANANMDASRIARFYNAFKESPLYKKPPTVPPKKDKEKFLTPNASKGGGSEPTDRTDKKIYSRSEVDTFFKELPKKRKLNQISEVDATRLEKEYERAELEGRIR